MLNFRLRQYDVLENDTKAVKNKLFSASTNDKKWLFSYADKALANRKLRFSKSNFHFSEPVGNARAALRAN